MATKSMAKLKLKEFLAATPIGQTYTFDLAGTPVEADRFIQQMRVHLSRVKKRYRLSNTSFKEFKILVKNIEPNISIDIPGEVGAEPSKVIGCRITLAREVPKNLDAAFSDITL